MEFEEFILEHDGDDLGALALARGRYMRNFQSFDLALTTLECRRKLRYKVPQWYAVPALQFPLRLSAEQCSSTETAMYKATIARRVAGRIADLTGGLGVDSWAFSQVADKVLYNEMQPSLAAAAEHNFHLLGVNNIVVRNYTVIPGSSIVIPVSSSVIPVSSSVIPSEASVSPAATVPEILNGFAPDIIFLDPARRAADGRKVFRLEDCQPNVLELLEELFSAAPYVLLKLSPMADISLVCKQLGSVKEVHVVAADGECKELLLLLEKGYVGEYDIFIYESGSQLLVSGTEVMSRNRLRLATDSKTLFEPGKGLLKAGAFDLPCEYGLTKLGKHTHLYVGETVPEELRPFGKCFEIVEVLPLNNKTVKELGLRYKQAEVTARNVPITSDELRRKLGCRSGGEVHIFGVHIDANNSNFLIVAK